MRLAFQILVNALTVCKLNLLVFFFLDPLLLEMTKLDMEQKLNQQEKLLTEAFNRIEKLETLLQKNVSHALPSEFTSEPDMIDQNNSFYPHHSSMPPWIPFQYSPSPIFNQTANRSQNPLPFQSPPISYNQTSQPASSFQSPPSFLQPSVHVNQLENSKCLRIQCKSTTTALPSSVINKTKLVAASYTLDRFPKLQTESKVSNLAVKLARSSFFWRRCAGTMYPDGLWEVSSFAYC